VDIQPGLCVLTTHKCQLCWCRRDDDGNSAVFYVGSRVYMHKSCIWKRMSSASASCHSAVLSPSEINRKDDARAYAIHCARLADASALQACLFDLEARLCDERRKLLDAVLQAAELPLSEELCKLYKSKLQLSPVFSVGNRRTRRNREEVMSVNAEKEVGMAVLYIQNFLEHQAAWEDGTLPRYEPAERQCRGCGTHKSATRCSLKMCLKCCHSRKRLCRVHNKFQPEM